MPLWKSFLEKKKVLTHFTHEIYMSTSRETPHVYNFRCAMHFGEVKRVIAATLALTTDIEHFNICIDPALLT